jgi:hypothetical protein
VNGPGTIDVPRLIRIVSFSVALLAGLLVYFAFAPTMGVLQQRIDDAQATLRSDEVAFSEVPRLREEHDDLARRYGTLFAQNPDAVFLRELGAIVRKNRITLLSTTVSRDPTTAKVETHGVLLAPTSLEIVMRGSYARLLVAIATLSLGSEIVEVRAPSMRRDGDSVIASIPLTIFEPDTQAVSSAPPFGGPP